MSTNYCTVYLLILPFTYLNQLLFIYLFNLFNLNTFVEFFSKHLTCSPVSHFENPWSRCSSELLFTVLFKAVWFDKHPLVNSQYFMLLSFQVFQGIPCVEYVWPCPKSLSSLPWCKHTATQRVLGLWIPCGGLGVCSLSFF